MSDGRGRRRARQLRVHASEGDQIGMVQVEDAEWRVGREE